MIISAKLFMIFLVDIYNNVYYINFSVFDITKTRFPLRRIGDWRCRTNNSRQIYLQNLQISTVAERRPTTPRQ
jgi:hypothetical protein